MSKPIAAALLIVATTAMAAEQKYSDGRPSATLRMDAKDHGIVLRHGDGPDRCDTLGARDVWVYEDNGTYYMHYDAAGPKGWLCSLATSKDLLTWEKKGPILDLGQPGEGDSKGACYGVTYKDDEQWHMFYLGTPNVTPAPDLIPAFPYLTMKAKGSSPSGPWIKQKSVVPFSPKPDTYYSATASPGQIIKNGDEYLQFFSASTHQGVIKRTLGIARTKNLDGAWTVDPKPILPLEEQIENSSLYYEKSNKTWFLFTNHIGIERGEYTDAIWVYWSKDLNQWDPANKAVVLDGQNCIWAKKCIGLPSVVQVGKRLALFYDAPEGDSISHMKRHVGLAWLELPLSVPLAGVVTANPSLEQLFNNPPDEGKPSGYWWWLNGDVTREAITRDLEEFKDKGLGAVLLVCSGDCHAVPFPFKGPEFLSPEFIDLYKFALQEADRLGLKVDVNIAPGWNMGGPWVTKEKSGRWFLQSQMMLKGPQKFSGKLPLPGQKDGYDSQPMGHVRSYIDRPLDQLDYRDSAVVAFRSEFSGSKGPNKRDDLAAKSNREDGAAILRAEKVMSSTLEPWESSTNDSHVVNPKDVIDLTDRLEPDGTLNWKVPAGDWVVVRTGHRMTGAQLSVPAPGMRGLENDFLDRAGVELMWENAGKIFIEEAGPLAGTTLRAFVSDSFECGYPNWTANLIKRFKAYRGYDPVPYLPVLKGWIVGSAEISERFLHDYRKTVADCMADEHYGRFTELCHENNIKSRAEAAGPSWSATMCMDGLKNSGRVDYPQGEFWQNEAFMVDGQNQVGKMVASAAHVYGKKQVSAEAFTSWYNWQMSPQTLKPVGDRAFCEGINYFVFCTTTCQRPDYGKPGFEYRAGTHFNPNVTWWDQAAGPFLDYVNRCQALLQSGLFVADVLYYNGDWAPNLVGVKHTPKDLGKGYSYDVCNAEVLLTRLSVKDGRLVLPDGMSYRLLVLPDSARMPVEVIEIVEQLVNAGATIVGPKPQSDPGLKHYPRCDEAVRRIAGKLWGNVDGKSKTMNAAGKGRVFYGTTPRQILQSDGIDPDLSIAGSSEALIDWIHRVSDGEDVYFLANRRDTPEQLDMTFRQKGRQPELWDPVSGTMRDLPEFVEKDGLTSVPLSFEPHGSMFIVFRKPVKASGSRNGRNTPELKVVKEIKGPFAVQFDFDWFYPTDNLAGDQAKGLFVFEELTDWTKHSVPAVKFFSGTAIYRTEFEFEGVEKEAGSLVLDLGVVNASASVRLNGVDLGVVWCAPWQIDVSRALKPGVNQLEVEVVNVWANRIAGDAGLPEAQRRTRTNKDRYNLDNWPRGRRLRRTEKEAKLAPSGWLGPVKLMHRSDAATGGAGFPLR